MAELFADENDVMLPCKEDFKELYHKWQRLTDTQRHAVKVHIGSYYKSKTVKKLTLNIDFK